jgi:hypothetical protein
MSEDRLVLNKASEKIEGRRDLYKSISVPLKRKKRKKKIEAHTAT